MALVFQRRLAIPLWAIAFIMVALTVPPRSTLFVIAVVGMAMIIITMPRVVSWHTPRSVARVLSPRQRETSSAALTMAAGTYVRTLDEPKPSTVDDALDLVRMNDDGGWHMARPPVTRQKISASQ
jgi:hypothetical protein